MELRKFGADLVRSTSLILMSIVSLVGSIIGFVGAALIACSKGIDSGLAIFSDKVSEFTDKIEYWKKPEETEVETYDEFNVVEE